MKASSRYEEMQAVRQERAAVQHLLLGAAGMLKVAQQQLDNRPY
jgi:hypothetical protein